jgi:hypothetical protein
MKLRLTALAALCALGLTAGAANAMPSIESFYAKDEGAKIVLKARWCVPSHEVGDNLISTFRMWDETSGALVSKRLVRGRASSRCHIDSVRLPDRFRNGLYSANVAVSNVSLGSYTRIGARPFGIY